MSKNPKAKSPRSSKSNRRGWVFALLPALLALGAMCWHADKPTQVPLPLSAGGVTLKKSTDRQRRGAVQARAGDFVLSNPAMSVVVGRQSAFPSNTYHGWVLDASPTKFNDDHLFGLWTAVELGGRPLELVVDEVVPKVVGRPLLVVKSHASRVNLKVETELRLDAKRQRLLIRIRAINTGETTLRALAVGSAVLWPGAPPFAPRLGWVESNTRGRLPFLLREGKRYCSALVFPNGADVEFLSDLTGPSQQRALARARDLQPGGTLSEEQALIVREGGAEKVIADAFRYRREKLARIRGKLSPAPRWAQIQALHPDGRVLISMQPDPKGNYELSLPLGKYILQLQAPGGQDRQTFTLTRQGEVQRSKLVPPEPGIVKLLIADDNDRPLAARWRITGIPPTKTPSFGRLELAKGAGNLGYTLNGQARIELPPGDYRVLVSHGPEYGLWKKAIRVSRKQGQTLRARIPHIAKTPGWASADLHVHSAPSPDSTISLADRITSLVAEGIDFAIPTDHNHITDFSPTLERMAAGDRAHHG